MIKYVDNGSIYEISENDVEMILITAAESAEIDLKTCSQRQWKWCLQQAGKYLNRTKSAFKYGISARNGPCYSIPVLIEIYRIYIELNNKYNKFISIEGFAYFSGISQDVIRTWSSVDRANTSNISMDDNSTDSDALEAETIANNSTYNRDNIDIYNIYNSVNSNNIDNDNINNKVNKNNKDTNSSIRYINKGLKTVSESNSQHDYNSRRMALYGIYSGLMSGKRECILDKAYDSNTGLSSPFLYNTEFGQYSGADTRAALPVSGGDRQAIAARYGFQAIEQHDD